MPKDTDRTRATNGFLSSPNPLLDVGGPFEPISHAAKYLPELIDQGSSALRIEILSLPLLDTAGVVDPMILRALLRDYHYLQSAFVKIPKEIRRIPASIAIPSYELARRLGRKPMLAYASAVLDNWSHDSGMPFTYEHVHLIRRFTKTRDENGFIVPHVLIEHEARNAISQILPLIQDTQENRVGAIPSRLHIITEAFERMQELFACITKHCEPHVYFEVIRLWISGFKDVIFNGVTEMSGVPQSFIGASGAQSSILPAIDAILCIRHDRNYFSAYLEQLRGYMPQEHRQLIEQAERAQPLRTFIRQQSNAELTAAYNECIWSILSFRRVHTAFTKKYISQYSTSAPGTGGSAFGEFLDLYTKDTQEAMFL